MNLLQIFTEIVVPLVVITVGGLYLLGGPTWRQRIRQYLTMGYSRAELIRMIPFALCAVIVILALLVVVLFVGGNAFQTFTRDHVSLIAFFTGKVWYPDNGQVGALYLIVGTLTVTVLAVVISTPISVALAVFVTEVAPPWARQFMQPVLELFAGIPSIVYGLLGIELVVPLVSYAYNYLVGAFLYAGFGVIAAGLVLAIMILPTITSISIDALAALPQGLREASLALGATRWQ